MEAFQQVHNEFGDKDTLSQLNYGLSQLIVPHDEARVSLLLIFCLVTLHDTYHCLAPINSQNVALYLNNCK